MEKKLSYFFGIVGGFFLTVFNPPFNVSMSLRGLRNDFFSLIFTILSFIGILTIILFSILLIREAIMTLLKK